jgi:hypothetical protein
MVTCMYKENDEVHYKLDPDTSHMYIVRDATEVPTQNTCMYHIELTTDSAIQLVDVPESYMTDTRDPKGKITPEASTSS